MKILQIYTDGSCIGNPGAGGWGTIIRGPKGEIELSGPELKTTNNRMEMTAVLKAFEYLNHHNLSGFNVRIHSDSSLVINTFTKGWKKKANQDIWAKMDSQYMKLLGRGNTFEWVWVKGHAGHPENERCDKLAQDQARSV